MLPLLRTSLQVNKDDKRSSALFLTAKRKHTNAHISCGQHANPASLRM